VTVAEHASVSPAFHQDGFAILSGRVDFTALDNAVRALEKAQTQSLAGRQAGFRDVLSISAMATLAQSRELRELASELLGRESFVVRALLFDKNPTANWKVAWHQDLTICVRERIDIAGFGPWSLKEGVLHVQPPVKILERMITLRVHLDDCDQSNGALRVLPGSHLHGKLNAEAIAAWRTSAPERLCVAVRGDVLAIKPLLLHASSAASEPGHRRVLHLEFAGEKLPGGLQWQIMPAEPVVAPCALRG
jgi:ectoine hydroxylase-related dioxygenase (phytanoyl-CoA dioxygenase family)